ncbi:MAG: ATP-binding protein [Nanoarchaeota archaeon]|nr:ATP-binding protein [Nanoarchaeota archaeon]MBU1321992.1 ATP-binding protein [Nanoarchaeota archaeon]MBU1597982.1 ATP-binding protein [Nanoarchaeota archaeon]MBU2441703.1 ATP-binding protein [Nanoarchaeota archaeon]
MILKDKLREIVKLQREELKRQNTGIPRELIKKIDFNSSHAIIISGIRRCGKSTLLRQIMKKTSKFYYFNLEDSRANDFELADFEKLNKIFKEDYGEQKNYFFDEIQNVPGWEKFIRRLQDNGKKVFITGSNASLLSKELGTRLTGRHLTYELFPFSFIESLELKKENPSLEKFQDYLNKGGFPEYLKYENNEILQQVFKDIIIRDIVARYGLRSTNVVKELALYLITNTSKEFTHNQLRKIFEVGSTNTITSYISYYEESYLLFTIPQFNYSYKKQLVNAKKIYAIDTGLIKANTASFSEDKGRILENSVFLKLRRKYKEIYYFKEKYECDFVIKEKGEITQAYQVCYELNEHNQNREINGLKEAMKKFKLKKGIILTLEQKDEFENISVIPAYEWMKNKQ